MQIWQVLQSLQLPQLAHEQFIGWQSQNGGCRVAHAGSRPCCLEAARVTRTVAARASDSIGVALGPPRGYVANSTSDSEPRARARARAGARRVWIAEPGTEEEFPQSGATQDPYVGVATTYISSRTHTPGDCGTRECRWH